MNQQNKSDALEIFIILAMFLLVLVIYVPVAIWEEETYYEKESRYRMQNLNDIQSFFSRLTGGYTSSFSEALSVVNAVRDSSGNFYVVGLQNNRVGYSVGLGITNQNPSYLIVMKLNSTGVIQWQKKRIKSLS